ncbi:MAG TPA: hypothetical protein VD908_17025 [Cytophagales bacterium]|nr:hypothetical protein [Cytophagales bacterium]
MNRLILAIFLVLGFTVRDVYADPDPPVIRAIVEIRLVDGSLVQGLITTAYPCDATKEYVLNAIFFQKGGSKEMIFFDFDLEEISINQKENSIVAQFATRNWIYSSDVAAPLKLKYSHSHVHKQDIKIDTEPSKGSLTWSKTLTYTTVDFIEVETLDSGKKKQISLNQIQSLKLLKEPLTELLNKLRVKREKELKERPDFESGDGFYEPIWYHEIIKDPKLLHKIIIGLMN